MPDVVNCPACGQGTLEARSRANSTVRHFECPSCGEFGLTYEATYRFRQGEQDWILAGFLRHRRVRDLRPVIFFGDHPVNHEAGIVLDDVRQLVPDRVKDIQDELLVALSLMSEAPGHEVTLSEADAPLVYSGSERVLRFYIRSLRNAGLLTIGPAEVPGDVCLTTAGWSRAEELRSGIVERPRQGFIAMCLHDDLAEARAAMIAGVEGAGYEASIMGERQDFNDDVVARILAEVRKSRFVVADFTRQRGGVYYEAGFARGLGMPVVFTCSRGEFEAEGAHFDTEHEHYLLWSDPVELREKLKTRIEMSIGRPPQSGGDQ